MPEATNKKLCEKLLHADHEDEVVAILEEAGYWNDRSAWRDLGDNENNYGTAGAQQTDAVAAFVEKLVNSADARLVNACLEAGIDPQSDEAPQTVREGVAKLIKNSPAPEKEHTGKILNWTPTERREQAEKITVAATGAKSDPCFTIVDLGEGQSPSDFPDTFMSLGKSNKLRVPFVQGKFNMGGTGALRFCGRRRIQLIISKRNPALTDGDSTQDSDWGFTVVRRDEPTGGERSSVFRYLAPLRRDEELHRREGDLLGEVLHFPADTMPILPEKNVPYVKPAPHGTLIKLYNYQVRGKSHILLPDGLARSVDMRLPDPALPFLFHECRDFKGRSEASFVNPVTGLFVRLEDNKAGNLDDAFPLGGNFFIDGQEIPIRFFGFEQGKMKSYVKQSHGVMFVVNGQTQGNLHSRFYKRKSVKFGAVSDDLVTVVDCSKLDRASQEELFMNNRESLADSDFRRRLERELEKAIAGHQGLREFNARRREQKLKKKLDDDKSIEDALKKLMGKSNLLSKLFLEGDRISNPTDTRQVGAKVEFEGQQYPTFFRHRKRDEGHVLKRACEAERSVRIMLETDAENDYFTRAKSPGEYTLHVTRNGQAEHTNHSLSLYDGRATLSLEPSPPFKVGDDIAFKLEVDDDNRINPFVCEGKLTVTPKIDHPTKPSPGPKPPSNDSGQQNTLPSGIKLPETTWVSKEDWEDHGFDKFSALKIDPVPDNSGKTVYDFYLNEANTYLENFLAEKPAEAELTKRQYQVAMVLAGLGMIYADQSGGQSRDEDSADITDLVAQASKGLAVMLIPIVQQLGDLKSFEEAPDTD